MYGPPLGPRGPPPFRGMPPPHHGGPLHGPPHHGGPPHHSGPPMDYEDPSGAGGMLQQGSVLMVYGLNGEKMNCQKVFNLFCLYGNVVRVNIDVAISACWLLKVFDLRKFESKSACH